MYTTSAGPSRRWRVLAALSLRRRSERLAELGRVDGENDDQYKGILLFEGMQTKY